VPGELFYPIANQTVAIAEQVGESLPSLMSATTGAHIDASNSHITLFTVTSRLASSRTIPFLLLGDGGIKARVSQAEDLLTGIPDSVNWLGVHLHSRFDERRALGLAHVTPIRTIDLSIRVDIARLRPLDSSYPKDRFSDRCFFRGGHDG